MHHRMIEVVRKLSHAVVFLAA